jgi:Cu/Ag efflux protein CusF
MKTLFTLLLTVVIGAGAASAAMAADAESASASARTIQDATAMSEGEIRKVDKGARKITIKHGPLTNLDMPAMTMVFRAKDPSMLDQVKPGDKVNFVADKVGGQFTIMKIELKK